MNDNFSNQKEKLLSLSHEINLLRQQVNFLLRNEKELGLLDLDVLMNRTHTIYDTLCSINLGDNADEEDMDFDAEAFTNMIGAMIQDPAQEETEAAETAVSQEDETVVEEEDLPEEPMETPMVASDEMPAVEPVEEPVEMLTEESAETPLEVSEDQPVAESVEETPQPEKPAGDDYGFFFRFENTPAEAEKPAEPLEEQPEVPVVLDDKLVHFVKEVPEDQISERDLEDGEHIVRDDPFEMPRMENTDLERPKHEILGEKMIQEDHSLAAKFQQNPVRDLKSVIGINDKFLFVNELFGGSMEKYNKSIENLNDLKTLNGAMIYLNELKIELQWNSSNEAYHKLSDLILRKFE